MSSGEPESKRHAVCAAKGITAGKIVCMKISYAVSVEEGIASLSDKHTNRNTQEILRGAGQLYGVG